MGELAFKITVKDDGSAVLERFGDKLGDTGKKAVSVGQRISAGFTRVRGVLGRLPGAVFNLRNAIIGLGAVTAIRAVVGRFAAFESQMLRVGVLVGETGKPFQDLTDLALELGETTAFSAKQAADGMVFLAKAGFEANEILQALPGTLELAAAAGLDLASAADIVTNVTKGLQIPISELSRANDVLVQTFTSSNVSLIQLGEAFKFVGPVAVSSGLQFEEVAAALALLGDAGIQGAMAGTTLRASIARLLAPSKEAAGVLKDLGVKAVDPTTEKLIPFADILEQLAKSGASSADIFRIFGLRAGPGIATLLAQGAPALREFQESLTGIEGRAREVAEVRLKGLSGALVIMRSAVEGAAIRIGESLAPSIKELAGFVTVLARNLSAAAKGLSGTSEAADAVTKTTSGLKSTLDAIVPGIEFLINAFFRVRKSIVEIGALFSFLKLKFLEFSEVLNNGIGIIVTGFLKLARVTASVFIDGLQNVISKVLAVVINDMAKVLLAAGKMALALGGISKTAGKMGTSMTVAATKLAGFSLEVQDASESTKAADTVTKGLVATTKFFAERETVLKERVADATKSLDTQLNAWQKLDRQQTAAIITVRETAAAQKDAAAAAKDLTNTLIEGAIKGAAAKPVQDLTSTIKKEIQDVTGLLSQTGLPLLQTQFAEAVAEIQGTGPKAVRAVSQIGFAFRNVAEIAAMVPRGLRDEFDQILASTNAATENMGQAAEAALEKTLALQTRRRQILVGGTAALFGSLAAVAETQGAKAFKTQQAFAAAQAVISGIQAVSAALAGPPGPPFSLPLAAAIAITAALNVRKILQARPGAGSAGSVAGAAGGAAGGGGAPGPGGIPQFGDPAVAAAAGPTQVINVDVSGVVGDEALLASEIGRVLREGEADGVQVNIT